MTIRPRSCSRFSRRALERSTSGDRPGVSSMKTLAWSFRMRIALVTRLQSSSSSWPVRRRVALMRPTEEIRRMASWPADISMEKTATAFFDLMAAYSAMFSANVVLPMAGRAARITRSVGCRPAVIMSNSV